MSTPYPGKTGPLPDPTFSRIPADSRRTPDYNFPSRAPTTRRVGYPEPYSSNRFYDNPDFLRSDRVKRAPIRKLATYDGTTSWDSFIFQFDRMANSFRWPEEERINRLMECLREEALEHFTFIPDGSSYNTIKLKMRQLFQVELTPTTARINARELCQQENESEEAFSKRVIKMVRIGYRDEGEATWKGMAIDTFIQGCSNSEAKKVVLNADPKGLPEAIRLMKQAVAADSIAQDKSNKSKKSRVPEYSVKQTLVDKNSLSEQTLDDSSIRQVRQSHVHFRDQQPASALKSPRNLDKTKEPFYSLEDLLRAIREDRVTRSPHGSQSNSSFEKSPRGASPSPSYRSNSPDRQWFGTPPRDRQSSRNNASNYQSPPRSPRNIRCYFCNKNGHYKNECPKWLATQPKDKPESLNKAGLGARAEP